MHGRLTAWFERLDDSVYSTSRVRAEPSFFRVTKRAGAHFLERGGSECVFGDRFLSGPFCRTGSDPFPMESRAKDGAINVVAFAAGFYGKRIDDTDVALLSISKHITFHPDGRASMFLGVPLADSSANTFARARGFDILSELRSDVLTGFDATLARGKTVIHVYVEFPKAEDVARFLTTLGAFAEKHAIQRSNSLGAFVVAH